MVAVVDQPWRLRREWIDGIEFEHRDTALREALEEGLRRIDSADAVVDYVDLDSLALPLEQEIRELPSDLIVFDDVGLQVDMIPGLADRAEHCGVGFRAVLQQRDLVSEDQRAAGDRLFEHDLLFQDIDVAGFALQLRQNGGAALRGKRAARVFEPGCLSGMPFYQRGGVGQRRAACRGEQR